MAGCPSSASTSGSQRRRVIRCTARSRWRAHGPAHDRLAREALAAAVIIAIDAASTDLSVALAEPDGTLIAEDAWSSAQRQSAELLPRLLALLAGAGRPLVRRHRARRRDGTRVVHGAQGGHGAGQGAGDRPGPPGRRRPEPARLARRRCPMPRPRSRAPARGTHTCSCVRPMRRASSTATSSTRCATADRGRRAGSRVRPGRVAPHRAARAPSPGAPRNGSPPSPPVTTCAPSSRSTSALRAGSRRESAERVKWL